MERKLIASKKLTDTDLTWYNLYSDGYVEQGGASSSQTVTLPIEMAGTSYSIQLTGTCDSTRNNVVIHGFRNRTTTSFVTQGNVVNNNGESSASNTSTKFWQVSGYATASAYQGYLDKMYKKQFIAY